MFMPVVLAILFYLISNNLKTWLKGEGKNLDKLDVTGATLSTEEAKSMAESFMSAMGSYGTDEGEIFSLFGRIDSQANFNLVYDKFGLRGYFEDLGLAGEDILTYKKDLIYWLNAELTVKEKENLSLAFPQINLF